MAAVLAVSLALLAGCGRQGDDTTVRNGIAFPNNAAVAAALQANFESDPNNAPARDLVRTLGGDQGQLDYRVKQVIYRQGAFETRYDVSLRMARAGSESLQKLYGTMVPKEAMDQLTDKSLAGTEKWLQDHAQSLEKNQADQAVALRRTLDTLGRCYRGAKAGDTVLLMENLGALVSPAREGWFAEKLQSPQLVLRCLPV